MADYDAEAESITSNISKEGKITLGTLRIALIKIQERVEENKAATSLVNNTVKM